MGDLAGPQITSIDPGNVPGGLFWTVPIPSDSVAINLDAGTAEYALNLVKTLDFHTFENDLRHGPSDPVTISFNVKWSGKKHFRVRDAATGFRGEFVEAAAKMSFVGFEQKLFNFVSDEADTSTSVSAVLGEERNGIFF